MIESGNVYARIRNGNLLRASEERFIFLVIKYYPFHFFYNLIKLLKELLKVLN